MNKVLSYLPLFFLCWLLTGSPVHIQAQNTSNEPELSETAAPEEKKSEVVDIFKERNVPQRNLNQWKKDPDYAYANDADYWKKEIPKENNSRKWFQFLENVFLSPVTRFLFYGALFLLGIYLIYRWIVENGFFIKKAELLTEKEEIEEEELLGLDNIDGAIAAAMKMADRKKVVRLQYIKLLLLLDRGKWIQYNAHTTNTSYLYELRNESFFSEFDFLTSVYAYLIYGGLEIDQDRFDLVQQKFLHLQNSLK